MFDSLKAKISEHQRFVKWREQNLENDTSPMNDFDLSVVTVGKFTYGGIRVYNFNRDKHLYIGNYCSIASDVMFILDADHALDRVSSFPFKVKCIRTEQFEATSKGDIIVDDDVWIGYGATILSGVHIGQGAVIAAGSVVSKDVQPYAIVGGVSAKLIKYRFSQPVIDYLLTLDYSKLDESLVRDHTEELYTKIDGMDLNEVKSLYNWFPKKIVPDKEINEDENNA